jgi:hypothetical protein
MSRLQSIGAAGSVGHTATAKPAITPLIDQIQGQALPEDFAPAFNSGKPTSAAELRKALTAQGYTVLGDDELNISSGPEARGWLEIGDLDHRAAVATRLATSWISAIRSCGCSAMPPCRGPGRRSNSGSTSG